MAVIVLDHALLFQISDQGHNLLSSHSCKFEWSWNGKLKMISLRIKRKNEQTRPKIGLKWCASCGSFALSTISIVLSPADWYLNTFSFVIFLPDVSDNTINQHSPVEMQCNLLMSFHLMNPFPIRILFFPIINNHVSPKRSILRHPALLSVCVNDHRPTFISR